MDNGDTAIIIALGVGLGAIIISVQIALFVLMWQTRGSVRREIHEEFVRFAERIDRIEERSNQRIERSNERSDERNERNSQRISEVEREQARLEGVNSTLSEILNRQSHTHETSDD